MAASNAADWFAGSMTTAAVIVALGGYGCAEWQLRRSKKDAERQSGCLIGVKLMKVMNGTDNTSSCSSATIITADA